jgi:hypothetical protein
MGYIIHFRVSMFAVVGFFAASESDRKWFSNGSHSGSGGTRVHCPRTDETHQITRRQGSSFSLERWFYLNLVYFYSLNLQI